MNKYVRNIREEDIFECFYLNSDTITEPQHYPKWIVSITIEREKLLLDLKLNGDTAGTATLIANWYDVIAFNGHEYIIYDSENFERKFKKLANFNYSKQSNYCPEKNY